MTTAMNCLGQLKLTLMNSGVFVSDEVRKNPEAAQGICPGKNREEIVFSLAEDFFVHTFLARREENSPKLKLHNGNLFLVLDEGEVEVAIIPPTQFLTRHRKTRNPVSANMSLDGYCLNLFLRTAAKQNNLNMTNSAVLSVIQSAFEEGAADLIQINMDYSSEVDRGFRHFAPLVEAIKKHFSAFLAFRGFPPDDIRTIDAIYAVGADLIVFPLQGFSKDTALDRVMPESQVLKSLEYAVGIFPRGSVSTEIVFGKGPIDTVTQTIDRLTQAGIIPAIKLPENGIKDNSEYDRIKQATKHLAETAEQNHLVLKWLYPSSRFVTPLDARFFTESSETARLAVRPVYQSTLGKKASEGFAALRRKLRVKNISDSYESAGL